MIQRASQIKYLRGFCFFSAMSLLTACAVLSPVSAESEQPEIFLYIETVEPRWLPFADGVGYFHGKVSSPRLEFWALSIDLNAPNVSIVVKDGSANDEGSLSTKVSSFVRENNLIAGINAVPFDVASLAERQPINNIGVVISDGVMLSPLNHQYDALVFYYNHQRDEEDSPKIVTAAIVSQSSVRSTENIKNAVGGFHQILISGVPAQRTQNSEARHPRSAAGVSDNGNYLYFLVIDGRRALSEGSTERETALLLASLGSHNGINFDGGGSSALALRFRDGNVRVVNNPVNGLLPGQERAVAGCIGISAE